MTNILKGMRCQGNKVLSMGFKRKKYLDNFVSVKKMNKT